MTAILLLPALVATSILAAASIRLNGIVSVLLAAYVILIAQVVVLVAVLSPFERVTPAGLISGALALLAGGLAVWWMRGRPRLPLAGVRPAAAEVARDTATGLFLCVVGLALLYELVLVLTAPPNNWDSLTYHLSRAAAWAQHGGVHWIPNAPTDRMNEFQSIAEQEILVLFVATGRAALFALPQYVAQLAIMLAIYGAARLLGHDRRRSTCAALLFASFSLVALEATTSQNDLVAASFPIVAAALLLTGAAPEIIIAGIAVGLGLGVKLTTLLVLPILLLLAARLGRRSALLFAGASAASFIALGMWGFVLNHRHTGHVLGYGGGRVELDVSPSPDGVGLTGFRTSYRLLDASGFGVGTLMISVLAWGALALILVAQRRRRGAGSGSPRRGDAFLSASPLLAPLLVLALALVIRELNGLLDLPVNDPRFTAGVFSWQVVTEANEDLSAFGPFGGLALLAVPLVALVLIVRRRTLSPSLVLGLSLPVFIVSLSLLTKYNVWLSRFLLVPVALTAPVLASLFRRRAVTAAVVAVATLTLGLALAGNELKPVDSRYGQPWQLSRADAIRLTWRPEMGSAVERLDAVVPARACIGALVGADEPSYLLYGRDLERRVVYLDRDLMRKSGAEQLPWIVLGEGTHGLQRTFRERGWEILSLGGKWVLATNPDARVGRCARAGG